MPADYDAIREWIGATPDDDTIDVQWARFDGDDHQVHRTALAILRAREVDLVDRVERFDIDGDYSETRSSTTAALMVIKARIGRLEAITGDTAGGGLPPLTSAPLTAPRGIR